jgi:hypothetical protein
MTTIAHPASQTGRGKSGDCGCGCGGNGGGNGHGNGHAKGNGHQDCSCGCTCESRCCDLECLVRPNFFCGQLLTDTDLKALVDWTRNRFSLSRFRHGWGVVCGLEVTCSDESGCRPCGSSDHGTKVYVNPGYAIDCCGNDLVVCEPCEVDLSRVCAPEDDPCADPLKVQKPQGDKKEGENVADENDDEGCLPFSDMMAVNLTLRYDEKLSHGQRAMFRSDCCDVSGCEYGRIQERPCVYVGELEDANGCKDDDIDAENLTWVKEGVDEAVAEITRLVRSGANLTSIIRHLKEHPPHSLCFIEEYLCCLLRRKNGATDSRTLGDLDRKRLAWWLWADRMLHLMRCNCSPCSTDRGVPIARVLLKKVKVRGGYGCRVMMVDERPPYRRPLTLECRPIAPGHLDFVPYLWHPRGQVTARLEAAGMTVVPDDRKQADFMQDTKTAVWSAARGSTIRLFSTKDPVKCDRVTGFQVSTPS